MSDHQGESNDQNFDDSELQEIMNEIEDLEREVSSSDSQEIPEEQPGHSPQSEQGDDKQDLQSEIDREVEEAQQSDEEGLKAPEGQPEMAEKPEPSQDHDVDESPEEMRSQMEVVPEEESSDHPHHSDDHDEHSDEEPAIEFDEQELRALEEDEGQFESGPNVSSFKKPRGVEPSSAHHTENAPIHFHAHGDMGVDLSFQVGEEHAHLSIEQGPSGKQGLRVQMGGVDLFLDAEEGCRVELEGGARFTVPVSSKDGRQKAS